jgi:preprotein translocase subunit Sss1
MSVYNKEKTNCKQKENQSIKRRIKMADMQQEKFRQALKDILAITLKDEGPDWEEIQEAQKIAADAIGIKYKPIFQSDLDAKDEAVQRLAELIRDL